MSEYPCFLSLFYPSPVLPVHCAVTYTVVVFGLTVIILLDLSVTCHSSTLVNAHGFSGSRSHHHVAAANNTTARFVARKKLHPSDSIGLTLVGGNAVGIFIHDVMPGSLLDGANGVHCGDQILEVLFHCSFRPCLLSMIFSLITSYFCIVLQIH